MTSSISERSVSFFTPIHNLPATGRSGCLTSISEAADNYLSFGRHAVEVISPAELKEGSFATKKVTRSTSFLATTAKIASMLLSLGILVLLALAVKIVARCTTKFHVADETKSDVLPVSQQLSRSPLRPQISVMSAWRETAVRNRFLEKKEVEEKTSRRAEEKQPSPISNIWHSQQIPSAGFTTRD